MAEADHNPQALKYLRGALDELECAEEDNDDLAQQFALHYIFRGIVLLNPEHDDVQTFIEESCYQIASGAVRSGVGHMRQYLVEGISWLMYSNPTGSPRIIKPKSQWEKARDGEVIHPGDPEWPT